MDEKVIIILLIIIVTVLIFPVFYVFSIQTSWFVDEAQYTLIVKAKGTMNNLTVTKHIEYFNASMANISKPSGINVTLDVFHDFSEIKVRFENFTYESATIRIFNMKPMSSIPVDKPYTFTSGVPSTEGDLGNLTNLFYHFAMSASTPVGKINMYTFSREAVYASEDELMWAEPQSKERVTTVFNSAFILLSVTTNMVFAFLVSFAMNRNLIKLPILTFLFSSVMCLIYVYIGVGNDLLFLTNANLKPLLVALSPVFHFNYSHLMSNLLYGFLIGGTLSEMWLVKFYGWKCYLLFLFPLSLSVLFTTLVSISPIYSSFLSPGAGASLWIIGIATTLVLCIYRKRSSLQLISRWDLTVLLLSGYLLVSAIWNYIVHLLINYPSQGAIVSAFVHLAFAAFCYFPILLLVVKLAQSEQEDAGR